jgi:hypothetical protein
MEPAYNVLEKIDVLNANPNFHFLMESVLTLALMVELKLTENASTAPIINALLAQLMSILA